MDSTRSNEYLRPGSRYLLDAAIISLIIDVDSSPEPTYSRTNQNKVKLINEVKILIKKIKYKISGADDRGNTHNNPLR